MTTHKMSTLLQHQGKRKRIGSGLIGATENSVTFTSQNLKSKPVYSRLGNTTNHDEIEIVLAALEGAEGCIVTGSGMAAFNLIFMSLLKPGDHVIVQSPCYGGTLFLLSNVFSRWGIRASFLSPEQWEESVSNDTKMIIVESISNPFCTPQNLDLAISFAKKYNLISVCDNTFASPILCQPLLHGIDLVVESATKYLNGHSDVVAGLVASRLELIEKLRPAHAYLGSFLPPAQCSLLLRGLKSLDIRMIRHSLSGELFYSKMKGLKKFVTEVSYGSDNHELSKKFFPKGFGGMVSVRLSDAIDISRFLENLSLVTNVPSLGGTESTVTVPSFSTNWFMTAEEKNTFNINDQLLRFSIGLEDVDDIFKDVLMALEKSC